MTSHETQDGCVRIEKEVPEEEIRQAHENGYSKDEKRRASLSEPFSTWRHGLELHGDLPVSQPEKS